MSAFNSVFDIFKAPAEDWKTRKWHWMSGSQLPTDWNAVNLTGTSQFRMSDNINQGFEIFTNAVDGTQGYIDFNNIRHYDEQNFIEIWEMRTVESTFRRQQWGMFFDFTISADFATVTNDTNSTNYEFVTKDATVSSVADSGIPIDEVFRSHKIVGSASDYQYTQDGVLLITKLTNLPTQRLQPAGSMFNREAANKTGRWNFVEVFAT